MTDDPFDHPGPESDPGFRTLRDSEHPNAVEGRELTRRLWLIYRPFADPNFLDGLQTDFNARFWEMYLFCALQERGFRVSRKADGPDVVVEAEPPAIIDAVAPGPGQEGHPDRVPDLPCDGVARQVPVEQIILRIRHAIEEKHRQYQEWVRKGTVKDGIPFVVAVNGRSIRSSVSDGPIPYVVQAVYPFGSPYVTLDRQTGTVVGEGHTYRPSLTKSNRAPVSTDIFLNPEYASVSAVLYSRADAANPLPAFGHDFILVHNYKAKNPLPRGFLGFGWEYAVVEEDGALRLDPIDHNGTNPDRSGSAVDRRARGVTGPPNPQ